MKAFSPLIKNSYRRLTHPSPVPVRFFAQNKGGAPPKGNFPQQGKPNQKPQQQQPKQPFQQPKQQQNQQQQQPKQHQQNQQQQPKQQQQNQQNQQPPQQPKSNVPVQQAAAPPTLSPEVVKKDLLTLFAKEVDEIKKDEGKTALANEVKKYLDQSGFKVDENEDGSFLLKKSDKNYNIEVSFEQSLKEGDNYEGEEDFGNEDEMEKDFSEEADGDEEGKDKVNYSAQIHILDKTTGTFVAEGFVGGDGRLYVESVVVSDSISKEEKPSEASLLGLERGPVGPTLEFQNLPQNTQDKLYDFLDSIGIDDQMAQFMKAYTQEYIHVKNEIEFYEKFRKLLS